MSRKKSNKKPTRVFTHADVVAFFWSHATAKDRIYTLEKVSLLPQIAPGGWQVDYRVTDKDAIYAVSIVVVQMVNFTGKPDLTYAKILDLPEGMASPSEEDAEIERQRLARLAKYEEEERKQRDGNHNVSDGL